MGRCAPAIVILLVLVHAAAAQVTDTVTVSVEVFSTAQITVLPESINWTGATVGSPAGQRNLTVRNTGSVNVTNLHVYADTLTDEISRPYGSGSAAAYASGGILAVINNSIITTMGTEKYYFIGRIEWNSTEPVLNTNKAAITSPVAEGFFINNSNDFYWTVGRGAVRYCNETGAQFAIEDDADDGTVSTRTPSVTTIFNVYNDTSYSYFEINRTTSPLHNYCVAVNYTCENIYIYKFDKRTNPNFNSCGISRYLTVGPIVPNAFERVRVDAFLPRGLPAGNMTQGTLTFSATSS